MICLVTDRRRVSAGRDAADRLVDLVADAASAGVDLIQIRERDLDAGPLVALVRRCLDAVRGTAAKVLVNDRIDVAVAARAHGVHLRSDSIDASAARAALPPEALLGRSVHTIEEAASVTRAGAIDYLILGTLFQTVSKDSTHRLTTLDDLWAVSRMSSVPVLAIGGMTLERASAVAQAGASGVAGIGLFIPPDGQRPHEHLRAVVAGLRRVFDTCGAVP